MGEISFNVSELKQDVLPSTIKAKEYLNSAKSILSSINIPKDFSQGNIVKSATSEISNIQEGLNDANNSINETIIKIEKAQKKNNQIVNSIIGSLGSSLSSGSIGVNYYLKSNNIITIDSSSNNKTKRTINRALLKTISKRLINTKSTIIKELLLEKIKRNPKAKMSNASNINISKGIIDAKLRGDGYPDGTYISLTGIKYKAYRQDIGPWANKSYWGGTIENWGCGPTSLAILASGLISPKITPAEISCDMRATGSDTLLSEMNKLGMKGTLIEHESAEDIKNALKEGDVMLVSVGPKTKFTNGTHIMAVVDINSSENVFVINPNSNGSTSSPTGWYNPQELITGSSHNDYIITTNAKQVTVSSKKTNNNYSLSN